MLKHAPAHPPVIAATSGRPSGLHPIRLAEGRILGHLGVPGGDDDIATDTRASGVRYYGDRASRHNLNIYVGP